MNLASNEYLLFQCYRQESLSCEPGEGAEYRDIWSAGGVAGVISLSFLAIRKPLIYGCDWNVRTSRIF
jgi:hypothetical protein